MQGAGHPGALGGRSRPGAGEQDRRTQLKELRRQETHPAICRSVRIDAVGDTTRRVFLVVAALTTIGCDQATKYAASRLLVHAPDHSYVADVIRVGYAENTG